MHWTIFWTLIAQVSIASVLALVIATIFRIWYVVFFGIKTNQRQDSYDIFHGIGRDY